MVGFSGSVVSLRRKNNEHRSYQEDALQRWFY